MEIGYILPKAIHPSTLTLDYIDILTRKLRMGKDNDNR